MVVVPSSLLIEIGREEERSGNGGGKTFTGSKKVLENTVPIETSVSLPFETLDLN